MRMSLAGIGLAAVVVLGGGYSAFWYHEADLGRANLQSYIARVNAQTELQPANGRFLKYDAIHASGYPFRVTLTITNPVFTVPMTKILSQHAQTGMTQRPPGNATPQWTEILRTSELSVSRTVYPGSAVTVRLLEPLRDTSIINTIVRSETLTTMNDGTCNLDLPGTMLNPTKAAAKPDFLRARSFIACRIAGARTEDMHSRAQRSTIGESTFRWSNDASAHDNRKIQIAVHAHGVRFYPAGDAPFQTLFQTAYAITNYRLAGIRTINPSVYGDIEDDIDIAYDGPVRIPATGIPIRLDIDRFDQKNALASSTFAAHAATDGEGTATSDSFTLHSRADINERYTQVVRETNLANARISRDPQTAMMQRVIAAATPNFHGLGTLAVDIDGTGNVSSAFRADARERTLDLRTFAINVTPYGVELHGKGTSRPTADFVLTLRNADRLISDFGIYGSRIESALYPNRPRSFFTPQTIAGARELIHGIAEKYDTTKPNAVIRFDQSPGTQLKISGKDAGALFFLLRGAFPTQRGG